MSSLRPAPSSLVLPGLAFGDTPPQKKPPRILKLLPFVFLSLVALDALALAFTTPDIAIPISGFSQLLAMIFSFGCTLVAAIRTPRGRAKVGWCLLAFAQFSYSAGDIGIIILSAENASATAVSLADVFFLQLAPVTSLGVIFFPPLQSSAAKQVRVILDVLIVVGALVGLALEFLIAPRYQSGTALDYVFIAYPIVDVTLLLVLLVLLVRGVEPAYRPVLFWMTIGALCFIVADTAYNYLSLPGFHVGPAYQPGTFYIDPIWVAAALAFSLAAFSRQTPGDRASPQSWLVALIERVRLLQPSGIVSQLLFLVTPVLLLFGLVAYNEAQNPPPVNTILLAVLAFLVTTLIIARQILTQRDLVDARIATERAQELNDLKNQFIVSVNHELRTPLMTMSGYIRLLADPTVTVAEERRNTMLARAERASDNLVHLVQSILDTRNVDQEAADFEPQCVSIAEVAQQAASFIDPREVNPDGREVHWQIPEHLQIWGDAQRLQQVLTNLLTNALKYSPKETPVQIRARLISPSGTFRKAKGVRRPMVEIAVRDWGLGIPPEQQGLLFQRFVRLPRDIASQVRGTGLGLYLCRVYVEAMGGRIWVESTGIEGQGSSFYVRLPVPPPAGISALETAQQSSARAQ